MEGFDREALVRSSQAKQRNGAYFWGAVAALPVVGIAAGLALAIMPGSDGAKPLAVVEKPPETRPGGQTGNVGTVAMVRYQGVPAPQHSAPEGYSARAELRKYGMVRRTLLACAGTGPAEHYQKASETYGNLNSAKTDPLRELAETEPPEHDLSAFDKEIPTNPAEIMVQGMTGQIAMTALQRANQFETMMSDIELQATGYLGKYPDAAGCTQFRNDVVMGKYNLELPAG